MCGILCVVGSDDFVDRARRAREIMASRGPDGIGEASFSRPQGGRVWLGHRRLAILDLTPTGAQPLASADGAATIVYNGEIYNAPALRADLEAHGWRFRSTGDTEVILLGYLQWGRSVVDHLIGMFAFVIWDARAGEVFAARDRLGIKPLYYAERRDGLAIASDSGALLALDGPRRLSHDGLLAYCVLGYVPTPMSIWSGISKLPSGSTLVWSEGAASNVTRFWQPPDALDPTGKTLDELDALVGTVVGDHLLSDVPIGVFLSSGIDSSLIASYAAARQPDLLAITVAFPDSRKGDEAPVAKETARILGLNALEIPVDASNVTGYFESAVAAFDEPIGYTAMISQLAISHAAQPHFKVALSGDGGDEVFGGYLWYDGRDREFRRRRGIADVLLERMTRAARGGTWHERLDDIVQERFKSRSWLHSYLARMYPALRPDELQGVLRNGDSRRAEELAIETLRQYDAPGLPLRRRLQRIDLMTFCQEAVLAKVDRAGMARSVEVRPPLLDHRVVEWGLSCPQTEWSDSQPKSALRALLERRGLTHLLSVPKRGFSVKGAAAYRLCDRVDAIDRMAAEADSAISPAWQATLSRRSVAYNLKVQALFILGKWRGKVALRVNPPAAAYGRGGRAGANRQARDARDC